MKRRISESLLRKIFTAELGVIVDVGITDGYMERVFVSKITTDVVVVFGEDGDMEWSPLMEFNLRKQRAILFSDDREKQFEFENALAEIEELDGIFEVIRNPKIACIADSMGIDIKRRDVRRI